MISLVGAMLRARWSAALTLALLALFATAAAVAGPAYLGAVDRSVVHQEVTAAAPDEVRKPDITISPPNRNSQYDRAFSRGKAMSAAPTWSGTR